MRDADAKLLALLRANAREPTASLARKLGLARSTVQERIARLEREGTIRATPFASPTKRKTQAARRRDDLDRSQARRTVAVELNKMPEVRSLSAVAGSFDLIATVETETPAGSTLCSTGSAAPTVWHAPCPRSYCRRSFRVSAIRSDVMGQAGMDDTAKPEDHVGRHSRRAPARAAPDRDHVEKLKARVPYWFVAGAVRFLVLQIGLNPFGFSDLTQRYAQDVADFSSPDRISIRRPAATR